MKLYIWEGVLEDYTCGIVCVYANNKKQAWELVKEKDNIAHEVLKREKREPIEIKKPTAFVVWGGG